MTKSTDKVLCACGCGDTLTRRQQTRHLQAHGPLMAVAGVIRTRAYFRTQDVDGSESPQPRKRQRVTTPTLEFLPPLTPARERGPTPLFENIPPTPSLVPAPALPRDSAISEAACTGLSVPWAGTACFRYDDSEVFEDSNDVNYKGVQFEPISDTAESESSSTDTDLSSDSDLNNDSESDGSETGEVPDVFDTNADLNAGEYSE